MEKAKNILNKFYRPNLYKAPQRRELTEEERIAVSAGAPDPRDAEEAAEAGKGIAGTGITVFAQIRSASNAVRPAAICLFRGVPVGFVLLLRSRLSSIRSLPFLKP